MARTKNELELNRESDPYGMLAASIVARAVEDWRNLIRRNAWLFKTQNPRNNFNEIRGFFKSDYCELLTSNMPNVDPKRILEMLEEELSEAKLKLKEEQTEKIKKAGRRT